MANFVTVLRLVSIPFLVRAILDARHATALALFLAAALTDALDGFLARRFHTETRLGAYLDPIADKLFLSITYITLAYAGHVPWWLVAIIFGRDAWLLLASIGALLLTRLRDFPPSVWGKASTFVQILCALTVLVRNATPSAALDSLSSALAYPVAALAFVSGIHYSWRGWTRVHPD